MVVDLKDNNYVSCSTINLEADILSQVNQIRAQGAFCGSEHYTAAKPLRWGAKLQLAADEHSHDMATQVMDMWIASPGHCVTLMTAQFVDLGVSCKNNSNTKYKTYWTLKAAAPF